MSVNEGDIVSLLGMLSAVYQNTRGSLHYETSAENSKDGTAVDGWANVTHSTSGLSGKVPVRFIEKQLTNQF